MTFQAYLDTIKEKTGMTPDDFVKLAEERGLLVGATKGRDTNGGDKKGGEIKAGPIIAWLDADYGLGRGHAMALVSVFRGRLDGQPKLNDRLEKFFASGRSKWQLTWDELMATVMKFGPDVALQPTDSYIGLTRAGKKFAVVATTANRMDVGLKLRGVATTDRLAASGTWNAMVTHRVQLTDGAELDDQLSGWLREAYDRA
jgi:hypothetical protein